ncbi:MAG: hypothetical protein U1E97_07295 [Alphaproteobacteria bacterium]
MAGSTLFRDASLISDALVTLARLAAVRSYSREFEREADAAAIDALPRLGIPAKAFAEMLDVLDARCGECVKAAGG